MKARAGILTLALCFVGVAASYGADDAFMGTWKLNARRPFRDSRQGNHL